MTQPPLPKPECYDFAAMPVVADISSTKARQQMERILSSKSFESVERLKRFLRFVVQETLEGRGSQLKEYVVGESVFEKGSSFDPRTDPIVRVQARRLRARLARYYLEEGRADDLVIELPKGGYNPQIRPRETASLKPAATVDPLSRTGIAVLLFDDISPDKSCGHLCKGIFQEIVNSLVQLETVNVVGADSMQTPEGVPWTDAIRRYGVATIIGGSVQKMGDQLRITSQIIDATTGGYLWSESVDKAVSDGVFEIQGQIARTITNTARSRLAANGWRRGSRHQPKNPAAHNLYQQGRYHLNQRTEESLRRSAGFFEKAIAEDPEYAQAYAGLSDAFTLMGHYGVIAPVEVWTKAPSNAGWSVLMDQNSVEAHTALAHVKATQDWDWSGADQEFKRALELDSQNSTAHHWYAMACLAPMGRLDEALEQIQIAQAIDPVSSIIARDLALVHYYKRDFEAALEQCDHTIELNPHFSPAYWALGLIQEQRGDFDESAAAFNRAINLSPQMPRMMGALGRTYALSGRGKAALEILKELHLLSQQRYVSPFELASIHFALGEEAQGFEWLKKAFQDRCFELVVIKVDPRFDPLKDNPTFIALSSQLGID